MYFVVLVVLFLFDKAMGETALILTWEIYVLGCFVYWHLSLDFGEEGTGGNYFFFLLLLLLFFNWFYLLYWLDWFFLCFCVVAESLLDCSEAGFWWLTFKEIFSWYVLHIAEIFIESAIVNASLLFLLFCCAAETDLLLFCFWCCLEVRV